MVKKRGIPIVLSAPSGGGKSTIAWHVLKRIPQTVRSISCTTRPPRRGERQGVDYFFISEGEFKRRIKKKNFLEWAKVHQNYYGTPKSYLDLQLRKGKNVLLTIDPQGAKSLRRFYPKGIYIFVVPPTWSILLKRLKSRGSDSKASLQVRLANAKKELKSLSHYDYLVVNDDLASAVKETACILQAERRRLFRLNKDEIPILKGL